MNRISFKRWLIIIIILIISGYSYFRINDFLRGPRLEITSPADGAAATEDLITISGRARRISKITLNGSAIFTDEAGYFNQSLLLAPGYNILVVAAEDRFERRVSRVLQLTLPRPVTTTTDYL